MPLPRRCPNLRYFSFGGVGTYAYERSYEPLRKGDEIGAFNLGSTIVLFFECERFEWALRVGDRVKMGERLGRAVAADTPADALNADVELDESTM